MVDHAYNSGPALLPLQWHGLTAPCCHPRPLPTLNHVESQTCAGSSVRQPCRPPPRLIPTTRSPHGQLEAVVPRGSPSCWQQEEDAGAAAGNAQRQGARGADAAGVAEAGTGGIRQPGSAQQGAHLRARAAAASRAPQRSRRCVLCALVLALAARSAWFCGGREGGARARATMPLPGMSVRPLGTCNGTCARRRSWEQQPAPVRCRGSSQRQPAWWRGPQRGRRPALAAQ